MSPTDQLLVFLRAGGRDPFRDARWPVPGEVIDVLRIHDLPYWVNDELWALRAPEPIVVGSHRVRVGSVTSLERMHAWTRSSAIELGEASITHARERVIARTDHDLAAALRAATTVDAIRATLRDVPATEPRGPAAALRMVGEAADDLRLGHPALALHEAAMAVGIAVAEGIDGSPDAFEAATTAERRWQAEWLAAHLGLEAR